MMKFSGKVIKNIIAYLVCGAILIVAPIMSFSKKRSAQAEKETTYLSLWQIDSFEGGRGSRASYLQNIADSFSETTGCYIIVTSLTADAARFNMQNGTVPDLISYGAGTYGIENYFTGETPFTTWCRGGYCLLTVDESADFSDCTSDNTVINIGTGNYSAGCALICGLNGALNDLPTGAYIKLINGKYKYLLGTQRDIFRLKTRGMSFKVKAIAEFNDLYQNISVTATQTVKKTYADRFIDFLLGNSSSINKIGLFADGMNIYDDEMSALENLNFDCKLIAPTSEQIKNEIETAIRNCDLKKFKTLIN